MTCLKSFNISIYFIIIFLVPFCGIARNTYDSVENLNLHCINASTPEIVLHKYYLSVSNIQYNSKVKALQIETRFFIDDMEDVLSNAENKKIGIDKNTDLKTLKVAISNYLQRKFILKADGKKRDIVYLGAELDGDQIVLYSEISNPIEPSTIDLKFTAFFEKFEEQNNMVHYKLKGLRKTMLLNEDKPSDFLKFS